MHLVVHLFGYFNFELEYVDNQSKKKSLTLVCGLIPCEYTLCSYFASVVLLTLGHLGVNWLMKLVEITFLSNATCNY